jgi:hypothetical protein
MCHQEGVEMTGRQAPYIAELRRDNDMETLVGRGEFAFLPQATESSPGGYRIGPQSVNRILDAEAVSPPCDHIRYEFRCSHGLPSQMNCSGKVTHFVTLVERYLRPASRNPAATDREIYGHVSGRTISGMGANVAGRIRYERNNCRILCPMLGAAWLENYFLPDVIIAVICNDKEISFRLMR